MAKSKQRGRPKTSKGNRVRVSIMLDPDLVEWSRDKRSDMVNRLLRAFMRHSKGGVISPNPDNMAMVGDGGEQELRPIPGERKIHVRGAYLVELIKRAKKTNDGNENDPV